ncbi:Sec-independent protein translocase subunit TatA [Actinomadura macrotermitis]|uniref:Sec-independent protein translocase protein TatA n=1 Tax=Actinomadura macrotermitis TaxID=2585200 RepID=A0A7K0C5G5_9ACTN|nr:Sec-independent protein translocase subunit TatA [Actinomadura macrotermitis]MQY08691.1 Sec-independent protein translocase protein TatA [Actinomadura macrotermitis]
MPNLGTPELLILLLVVVLIFGSAKLPQLARSLGKSARILKAETKGLREDDDADDKAAAAAPAPVGDAADAARARAAQLREEAARLEREAAAQQPYPQRTLPSGEPIQGVPLDRDQTRKS